jgi:hypothetical protein
VTVVGLGLGWLFLLRRREWRWPSLLVVATVAVIFGLTLWQPGRSLEGKGGEAGLPLAPGFSEFALVILAKVRLLTPEQLATVQANWLRPANFLLGLVALGLTLIGSYGFRLLALLGLRRAAGVSRTPAFYFLWGTTIAAVICGNFLILRAYARDTLHFYTLSIYALALLAVPVVVGLHDQLRSAAGRVTFVLLFLIIAFTTTTQFVILSHVLFATFTPARLLAARYLSLNAGREDVLLHDHFDTPFYTDLSGRRQRGGGYRNINYFFTPYTGLRTYYEPWPRATSPEQIRLLPHRQAVAQAIVHGTDRAAAARALVTENIQWVWVEKADGLPGYDTTGLLAKAFEDDEIVVYQVLPKRFRQNRPGP